MSQQKKTEVAPIWNAPIVIRVIGPPIARNNRGRNPERTNQRPEGVPLASFKQALYWIIHQNCTVTASDKSTLDYAILRDVAPRASVNTELIDKQDWYR